MELQPLEGPCVCAPEPGFGFEERTWCLCIGPSHRHIWPLRCCTQDCWGAAGPCVALVATVGQCGQPQRSTETGRDSSNTLLRCAGHDAAKGLQYTAPQGVAGSRNSFKTPGHPRGSWARWAKRQGKPRTTRDGLMPQGLAGLQRGGPQGCIRRGRGGGRGGLKGGGVWLGPPLLPGSPYGSHRRRAKNFYA